VKSTSDLRLAGLVAVRIAWITAFVVCALAILIGLFSGTDGGDSSLQLPGFGSTDGGDSSQLLPEFALFDPAAAMVGAEAQKKAQKTKTAAATEDAGGRAPVVTPRPTPPQAPSVARPEPPQALSVTTPEPPQAPSVTTPEPPQAPSVTTPELPQAPSVTTPEPPQAPSVTPPEPPQAPSGISVGLP
jgi:hypothetical protein